MNLQLDEVGPGASTSVAFILAWNINIHITEHLRIETCCDRFICIMVTFLMTQSIDLQSII